VEGWYGQPFAKPLERTREWLAIFRAILAREQPVSFEGRQYQLPYRGPGNVGLGKPLMSIVHPLRRHIPVFLGAEGPKNTELAAREFDGWFPLFIPPERFDLFDDAMKQAKPGFEILPTLSVTVQDDLAAALLPVKQHLALYIGGMGAKEENFHKRLVERAGYADAAQKIQDLWLAGRQKEAVLAVPDELADALSLAGSREHIRSKLARWKRSPTTTLLINRSSSFEETVRNMEFLAEEIG